MYIHSHSGTVIVIVIMKKEQTVLRDMEGIGVGFLDYIQACCAVTLVDRRVKLVYWLCGWEPKELFWCLLSFLWRVFGMVYVRGMDLFSTLIFLLFISSSFYPMHLLMRIIFGLWVHRRGSCLPNGLKPYVQIWSSFASCSTRICSVPSKSSHALYCSTKAFPCLPIGWMARFIFDDRLPLQLVPPCVFLRIFIYLFLHTGIASYPSPSLWRWLVASSYDPGGEQWGSATHNSLCIATDLLVWFKVNKLNQEK